MINITKDVEITILHQISKTVLHERDVSLLLKNLLDILHRELGFLRGTLTLLRGSTLYIEASHGLSQEEIRRGRYKLGEGITGRVGQTGQPILIPDIASDPNFLNRTKTRSQLRDVAFLCVPIIHRETVIGTLSIDRQIRPDTDLEADMRFLETVANITADAVALSLAQREERERLIHQNTRLKQQLDAKKSVEAPHLIGNTSVMRNVNQLVAQIAKTNIPVLISGAPGTGKSFLAKIIHEQSEFARKPLIPVNCAAFSPAALEAEIFGRIPPPDSGMIRTDARLQKANNGTLVLEEVAAMDIQTQIKLAFFLHTKTYTPLGSPEPIPANVRIIATTEKDLVALMNEGTFRPDLYYRLSVFPIPLPELRNRKADIILLAEHFIEKYNLRHNRNIRRISTPAINMLMSYHWPGNVRELENGIEHAVIVSEDDAISGYNLPPSLQTGIMSETAKTASDGTADFKTLVSSFERELIVESLKANNGNVCAAARALRLTLRIIKYKIDKLNIHPEWYRP